MARLRGRGRLSSIDLLPSECDDIISWAAQQLADRERTLLDIYAEFKQRLIALQGEIGLGFDIPAFSSFHRHSVRLAQMSRRLEQTREIAATMSERFDAEASDDLTLIAAEAIKTLIYELLESSGDAGLTPKAAMELANALRSATAAQSVSTSRRLKIEQEFNSKVTDAVETVAKAKGLSDEASQEILGHILGVNK